MSNNTTPVLFITGDQAHLRIFSEHPYRRASEPKVLFNLAGAKARS